MWGERCMYCLVSSCPLLTEGGLPSRSTMMIPLLTLILHPSLQGNILYIYSTKLKNPDMKGKLHYCEFIHHNSNSHQLAVKTQWQTSFVMLPWRRASICNRDNSWGMKALRRGRVTSGIKITDNSNQSKSNFLSCYQPESLPRKQKTKQNKLKKKNSNPNNIPFRNKTTVVTRKPGKTHSHIQLYAQKSSLCPCELDNLNSSNVWPRFKDELLQG